jgi:hypothetical protein
MHIALIPEHRGMLIMFVVHCVLLHYQWQCSGARAAAAAAAAKAPSAVGRTEAEARLAAIADEEEAAASAFAVRPDQVTHSIYCCCYSAYLLLCACSWYTAPAVGSLRLQTVYT